ncbi:MAG: GNAT family N-acetyltransferase [Ruminococcus sp.]|nr:GNAT family N-acetyltransferase [Ruminococcus sp.]
MRIIHAIWERRNIGSDTYEIKISPDDNFDDIIKEVIKCEGDYIVVKIPTGMVDFMNRIVDFGFRFVETSISCHYNISQDLLLPSSKKEILKKCSFRQMTDFDLTYLFDRLSEGLYTTDRIALDPMFSIKIANKRYRGWIEDELVHGSKIYNVICLGKKVGFFGLKKTEDKKYFGFLNGVYKEYQHQGFGTMVHCMEIQAAKDNGANVLQSAFSSNNNGAFSVHMSLGYRYDGAEYVFVKHQ